ncbi:MAG: winged helix-turn-helix transcriptional regulator [Desulfurococcales archaeon]|nr:winged helix-turn-helix transcriptional regulator [Desulfurococcales archaeon]
MPPGLVLLVLVVPLASHVAVSQVFEVSSVTIVLYEDGSAAVNVTLRVQDPPAEITVRALGDPIYFELVSEGVFQPVFYQGGFFNGTVFGEEAFLYYVTSELTSKNGSIWMFSAELPWPARVALPREALVLAVSPQPRIVIEGDTVYLAYEPGRISITYVIVPLETDAKTPTGVPTETTPPITGTSPAVTGTDESPRADGGALAGVPVSPLLVLAIAAVVAGLVLLSRLRRRGVLAVELDLGGGELDERDRAIIEAVRRLGEATTHEIMEATGIPKTPLYRRLSKLVDMGYLESYERAGRRRYRLKKPG